MEELLFALIQGILEIFFPTFFEFFIDLFSARYGKPWERDFYMGATFVLIGVAIGALSVWLLPDSLIHNDVLRYGNLILAPIVSYWVSKRIGLTRDYVNPISQARCAFFFTLSFVLVRFFFSTH
jgi:hypothetical protein